MALNFRKRGGFYELSATGQKKLATLWYRSRRGHQNLGYSLAFRLKGMRVVGTMVNLLLKYNLHWIDHMLFNEPLNEMSVATVFYIL